MDGEKEEDDGSSGGNVEDRNEEGEGDNDWFMTDLDLFKTGSLEEPGETSTQRAVTGNYSIIIIFNLFINPLYYFTPIMK